MKDIHKCEIERTKASEQLLALQKKEDVTTEELKRGIEQYELASAKLVSSIHLNESNQHETTKPVKDHPIHRTKIADYLSDDEITGAAKELNDELNLRGDYVPIDVFFRDDNDDDEIHKRADSATDIATTEFTKTNQGMFGRLWDQTLSGFFGINQTRVPAGTASYSVLNATGTASTLMGGTAKDATAASFTLSQLTPVEMVSRYVYRSNDRNILPSLESILMKDLREQLINGLDDVVLSGSGTAPTPRGLITLPNSRETQATTPALFIDKLESLLGSKLADDLSQLRVAIGTQTKNKFRKTELFSSTGITLFDFLRKEGCSVRSSTKIPSKASNAQISIVQRMYPGLVNSSRLPVWEGVQLLRDRTDSKREVELTAVMRYNFTARIRSEEFAIIDSRI